MILHDTSHPRTMLAHSEQRISPVRWILFVLVLLAAGCNTANRLTVDRTTVLPPLQTPQASTEQDTTEQPQHRVRSPRRRNPAITRFGRDAATSRPKHGTAIHLDAQQRLVLSTALGYCAEPSPDAMSAYATSIGLGFRSSYTAAASAAAAMRSYAANVGLRTQSITLMRDALYRMCEASNNDHLADWEIAAFLRRSQDLTAVILAVEQLTGAVAANQVTLAPGSTATVNMTSPPDPTDAPSDDDVDEPGAIATEPDSPEAEQDSSVEQGEVREELGSNDTTITVQLESQRDDEDDDTTTVESVRLVDPQTSNAVAAAVADMVTSVLEKDYKGEMCLSFMGSILTDRDMRFLDGDPSSATSFGGLVTPLLAICRDILMRDMERDGGAEDAGDEEEDAPTILPELPEGDDSPQPILP